MQQIRPVRRQETEFVVPRITEVYEPIIRIIVKLVDKFFRKICIFWERKVDLLKYRVSDAFVYLSRSSSYLGRLFFRTTLAGVPASERAEVFRGALLLTEPETDEFGIKEILEALIVIPFQERGELIRNALLLIKPVMTYYERVYVIQVIAEIPIKEKDRVVALALKAMNEDMRLFPKMAMVRAIGLLLAQERENVMHHAHQVFTLQMEARERVKVIKSMAEVSADERPNLVERLREERDAHQVNEVLVVAERGIDVHKGDRDQRVRVAIELLRKCQDQISKDTINGAVREFTHYLEGREMNSKNKKLAQHALEGPFDKNDLGPLFDKKNITIKGLKISGEELIGRLWIFASGLKEPEQTFAKEGIVFALEDSYDMGGRVCNPGKVQRLIVRVLQGRFPGVEVDFELIKETHIEIGAATEMFFNVEAHQAINQLAPLRDAANRFCDQNLLVNRAEFLREIEKYAKFEKYQ